MLCVCLSTVSFNNMVLILSGIFLIEISTVFCILEIINKSCHNSFLRMRFALMVVTKGTLAL